MTATNVILDNGGTNEVTILSTSVAENRSNPIKAFTTPTASASYASGPNETILINLLRSQIRFTVDGELDSADREKFRNLFNKGTTFTMDYDGETYKVLIEKYQLSEGPRDKNTVLPDDYDLKMFVIVGGNQ